MIQLKSIQLILFWKFFSIIHYKYPLLGLLQVDTYFPIITDIWSIFRTWAFWKPCHVSWIRSRILIWLVIHMILWFWISWHTIRPQARETKIHRKLCPKYLSITNHITCNNHSFLIRVIMPWFYDFFHIKWYTDI